MRLSCKVLLSWNSLRLFHLKTAFIPAECSQYKELNEADRYWKYSIGGLHCDTHIASGQWYRFTGAAGRMMATYCIPKRSCDTLAPGWIKGNHPSEAYQLASATVCFHWNSNCCERSFPVQIRNCSGYYVYELQKTDCHYRYCGVNGLYLFFRKLHNCIILLTTHIRVYVQKKIGSIKKWEFSKATLEKNSK